ncbi:LLM class flavin-dependent oxidoreductase [Nocardia sp. CA-135953]|uniref:LLM class flavin-dependent oxidoreductase n=1 Tax=Nocardia sp. CA-135953 TaxID=3239978 RepID=UPI003D95FE4B
MTHLRVHFDLRAPESGIPARELYPLALEQAAWLDNAGATSIMLSEHHGSDDQNCPSPLTLAAAIGAVTERCRILVSALLLPLHDPVRVAEDAAVADLVSGGRLDLVVGVGYVRSEFELFGLTIEDRARLLEKKLPLLLEAMTTGTVTRGGTTYQVTPRPAQKPRPSVLVGGSVAASARRAARLADGFFPAVSDPSVIEVYRAECARLGYEPGPVHRGGRPRFVFVSEDPDRAWQHVGPAALGEINIHRRWTADSPAQNSYGEGGALTDWEVVRKGGQYAVLTPAECIELARGLDDDMPLTIKPLLGGVDPDFSWECLEVLKSQVLPHLDLDQPKPFGRIRPLDVERA